jgi:hypothetical protein
VKRVVPLLFLLLASACAKQRDPFSLKYPEMNIPSSPPPAASWWHPKPGLTWQWQLTGKFDFNVKADVYDIDLHVHESAVEYFHSQGAKVICYISVGSFENWREDADQFPEEVLGKKYEGWSGERWLDIRRIDLLAPIMLARLDDCTEKGFDAVEPDNIEIHTNDTGFPLTYEDQLRYAVWLANEAHARGLAIGLKNAPDQVKDLVELYDFAITEDCFYYDWCREMVPFIEAGKAVFAAEYTDLDGDFSKYCELSAELGFSTILKNRDLNAWIQTCPK